VLSKAQNPDELAKRIVTFKNEGRDEVPGGPGGEDLNAPPKKPYGGH
jgi:hypothetical protein